MMRRKLRVGDSDGVFSACGGYFPSLSPSSSVESVDHTTYSARSLLYNVLPLLPAVPMNSRSASCMRSCLIKEITVLFWTLGFSECSSAKSKAIKKKKNWESTYAARFFSTVTMSGGLIFGPMGLCFPLYTSHSPVTIKAGTQPVTCRTAPGNVVKQRDWDD